MIHIIYILFIAVILGLYLRDYRKMKNRVADADAREQGLDEIEQGYQAEIMDLDDKLEATEDRIHNVYEAHRLMKLDKDNEKVQYEATIADLKKQILDLEDERDVLKANEAATRKVLDEIEAETKEWLEFEKDTRENVIRDYGPLYYIENPNAKP